MLKCNQPYIIPLIIAVVLIIIIGYKYKKIFFVLLGGILVWYVIRKDKIDLSQIQPNNIQHKDVFNLPLYFIEYK